MSDEQRPKEIKSEPEHNFWFYSKPANFAKIIGNRKLVFGTWGLVGYLGQFLLIVAGLNAYSDNERKRSCSSSNGLPLDESNTNHYDVALALLCAYHIIEWVRMTMFLVTLILGQNLIHIWYASALNTLFGIAAYIVCHIYRFNEQGKMCAEKDRQYYRGAFLLCDVIVFWVTFHIMSFPHIFLFLKKSYIEDALKEHNEEEEEEGGEEKKD